MSDVTIGEHRSRSHGTGFDFLGLRDWQAGDRFSSIDWAQSSLTNFSPLIVREFEQPSTATVVAIADHSLSTRCGVDGVPIAAGVARAIATVGMSAAFFQDPFGLVTFDSGFAHLAAIRPRTGKSHVVHCLDAYQHQQNLLTVKRTGGVGTTLAGYLRSKSMLPVISDFLFDDPEAILKELALLNATHDVFLVLDRQRVRLRAAARLGRLDRDGGRRDRPRPHDVAPGAAASWPSGSATGRPTSAGSRRTSTSTSCRSGSTPTKADIALSEFVAERRLRKTYN